jgi:transposase InsO family protein
MPWKVSGPMEERVAFVHAYRSGLYTMSELCRRFDISRQNGYKWLARYEAEGLEGLRDRSRAPRSCPHRISPVMESLVLAMREQHPTWGPRKIRARLGELRPDLLGDLPAASTLGALLVREGKVKPRKRRKKHPFTPAGALQTTAPNEVWTADYKGEFRLGNRLYCYPFTLADAHTRFLLACRGERSTALSGAQRAMIEAFRCYGLPEAIRTDNGTPFVGHGLTGLSSLSVWWIKLGIIHQRIPKSRPDQNGRHERMHRTLKAETARPPEASFEQQQRRFDRFRQEFNTERPHEALEQKTPASVYSASSRPFPETLARPEYPGHYEPRRVDQHGSFKFLGLKIFLAQPLAGEWLGLVEIDDDVWSIRFYHYELARINPKCGELFINVSPMFPV